MAITNAQRIIEFSGTKAACTALTATPTEVVFARTTDTGEIGFYDNGTWHWFVSGSSGITALTGDVTAGPGSGSQVATIAAKAVTLSKMDDMATASLIYRKTAGTGAPEVNTLATLKTDLGLTGTNSGDQTITLTGNVTGSGTGSFAATIAAGAVTLARMADMATASLIYRKTAGSGAPEVNTLSTLKTDLGLTGTNSGDQTITLTGNVTGSGTGSFAATIAAGAVTLAKMADMATASLIYRKTAGTGAPEVNTLATLKTDLGTMPPTTHNIITAHTYTGGAALDVIGLSAPNTIARLTPSANPGAAAAILASDSTGALNIVSYNSLQPSSANYKPFLAHPNDANARLFNWNIGTFSNMPTDARNNVILNWGYNQLSGGVEDATEAAFYQQLESYYHPAGSNALFEYHLDYINGATTFRPTFITINRTLHTTTHTYLYDVINFSNRATAAVNWQLSGANFTSAQATAVLVKAVNNSPFLQQLNAAGTTNLNLMYIDSNNLAAVEPNMRAEKIGVFMEGTVPEAYLQIGYTPYGSYSITNWNSTGKVVRALFKSPSNNTSGASPAAMEPALILARQDDSGATYANLIEFKVGKWEINSSHARSKLTIAMTHGSGETHGADIVSLLSNGSVLIGTATNKGLLTLGTPTKLMAITDATTTGSTKTTPTTVDGWITVVIDTTTYYVPAYTSKTA